MVEIIPQRPSFSQSLGKALGGGFQQGMEKGSDFALQMMEKEADLAKNFASQMAKQEAAEEERIRPLQAGLDTIKTMRDLIKTGHLGPKISQKGFLGLANEKVREHRAQYEQLGKSLISLASNIPIRNKAEFETLAEHLYDPTQTEATLKGILNSMEQIIMQNMGGPYGGFMAGGQERSEKVTKERRPFSAFER